jgi:hypothetical protein
MKENERLRPNRGNRCIRANGRLEPNSRQDLNHERFAQAYVASVNNGTAAYLEGLSRLQAKFGRRRRLAPVKAC